jgi:hypothetical protein
MVGPRNVLRALEARKLHGGRRGTPDTSLPRLRAPETRTFCVSVPGTCLACKSFACI